MDQDLTFRKEALEELKGRFLAFDTETTGLSAEEDRIAEISAVEFIHGVPGRTFSLFLNPERLVRESAKKVNGLEDDFLAGKKTFGEAAREIHDFFKDAITGKEILVGYSVFFDVALLKKELLEEGVASSFRYYDVYPVAKYLLPTLPSYKQGKVASYLGLESLPLHEAKNDALTCGRILLEFLKEEKLKNTDFQMVTGKEIANRIISLLPNRFPFLFHTMESRNTLTLSYGSRKFMDIEASPLARKLVFYPNQEEEHLFAGSPLFTKGENGKGFVAFLSSLEALPLYVPFFLSLTTPSKKGSSALPREARTPYYEAIREKFLSLGAIENKLTFSYLSGKLTCYYGNYTVLSIRIQKKGSSSFIINPAVLYEIGINSRSFELKTFTSPKEMVSFDFLSSYLSFFISSPAIAY
jgi:DNA polymerase III epsilon subunit family exonuclease